jgi:glycosyltransferase involved in cell wall biosynthesis
MPSLAGGFPKALPARRAVREVENRSDVVVVQLPFDSPLALLRPQKPRVYHLCADIVSMARTYCGYKRAPAVLVGRTIDRIHKTLFRWPHARVIANGQQLFKYYGAPPGRAVVSTTILDREIMSARRARPAGAPFRILYVGFLRKAKGIDTLLDAYLSIVAQLPGTELLIAGDQDKIEPEMMAYLEREVAQLKDQGHIELLGRVEFGPQLFQQFADADVLALPSRTEGTPRVLIEARSFGCPVVATNVGGIPTSVLHEVDGLLVPPDDASALAAAILRIARDEALRQRLIEAGLERARRSTIEAFAETMIDEALELVGKKNSAKSA